MSLFLGKTLENNIFKVLRDTVSRMDNNNKEMSLVLGEYEKTITQLIQEFICVII